MQRIDQKLEMKELGMVGKASNCHARSPPSFMFLHRNTDVAMICGKPKVQTEVGVALRVGLPRTVVDESVKRSIKRFQFIYKIWTIKRRWRCLRYGRIAYLGVL